MRVWVVLEQSYDEDTVIGVYTTYALAANVAKQSANYFVAESVLLDAVPHQETQEERAVRIDKQFEQQRLDDARKAAEFAKYLEQFRKREASPHETIWVGGVQVVAPVKG